MFTYVKYLQTDRQESRFCCSVYNSYTLNKFSDGLCSGHSYVPCELDDVILQRESNALTFVYSLMYTVLKRK